jgi:hypothetical protein
MDGHQPACVGSLATHAVLLSVEAVDWVRSLMRYRKIISANPYHSVVYPRRDAGILCVFFVRTRRIARMAREACLGSPQTRF